MDKMIEDFKSWPYLNTLPQELYGFRLQLEHQQEETQYYFFSYYNEALDKFFRVLYDKATKEYIARWRIGLIEFCDVNFIADKLAILEDILKNRLDTVLRSMAFFEPASLGSVFLSKKILEWPYGEKLEKSVQGFSLFIQPSQPLKGINGSTIIIDYSDFSERTNILIYYNIYRDVFFGEIIFRGTPAMTSLFDARALPELEEKLKTNLEPLLAELRQKLESERQEQKC